MKSCSTLASVSRISHTLGTRNVNWLSCLSVFGRGFESTKIDYDRGCTRTFLFFRK